MAVLRELRATPRTDPGALRDLLRALAASAIQEDPAQAQIPPGDWPDEIVEAIDAGARWAADLTRAGRSLSVEVEDLPLATPASEVIDRATAAVGPFVDQHGRLLRFNTFESTALLTVLFQPLILPPFFEFVSEPWLLLPADSTPDDATNQTWTLAAGTVWVRSRFIVPNAPDFTGVRIAAGSFRVDRPLQRVGSTLVLPMIVPWTLDLEVEQPAAADLAASDGSASTITVPRRLVVRSNAAARVTGEASLSGFGSDLTFAPADAAPFFDGKQICFPLEADDTRWSINGNRSEIAQFQGDARIVNPCWALPISNRAFTLLHEAPHGGSLAMGVLNGFTSRLAGQHGAPFRWFDSLLTANDLRIELEGRQVGPGGRYDDVELWTRSASTFVFAQQPIARLLYRSERGGHDAMAVLGGTCRNRWDLPRRADSEPFGYEGAIEVFGLLTTGHGGLLACIANRPRSDETAGLALENLYLVVSPYRRCVIVAAWDGPSLAPSGLAVLSFDTSFGLPTLPDPYAANLGVPRRDEAVEQAMRVVLEWDGANSPRVSAHLDRPVRFTEPPFQPPRNEDENRLYEGFRGYLDSHPEPLYLLDVSSREHLFGVALESTAENQPEIVENRMSVPLERVRLLMQPQVHWEPVLIEPNEKVPALIREIAASNSNGGPTLVGARSVRLMPVLPGAISEAIVDAVRENTRAAALFSLPFGLRAMAHLSPNDRGNEAFSPAGTDTTLHEPDFGDVRSARQLRLTARNIGPARKLNPSRYMPGMLRQLSNLTRSESGPDSAIPDNGSGLLSVTPAELMPALNGQFAQVIPLHHADLSGYGLTSFSEWRLEGDAGFTKVQFEVVNGRTAYEVLQFRSALYECGARLVRTVVLERRNSGRVHRTDSGWVAIESGVFNRPTAFVKGCVKAFHNIRRIRITGAAFVIDPGVAVQPVVFDADAEIEGLPGAEFTKIVPIFDRLGYVQVQPPPPAPPPPDAPSLLNIAQLRRLFETVGPISSPVDGLVRVGGTLDLQLSGITSDLAPDDLNGTGFAVAAVGSPALPRAGQWTTVRIAPSTFEAAPVDPRRGVPIMRNSAGLYLFREPSDARRTHARVPYGLLMTTQASRALFPQPKIRPQGRIETDAPLLADPYSLVQATSAFPRATYALRLNEAPAFAVASNNAWRIENPAFTFVNPAGDLLKGGEWKMDRRYDTVAPILLNIDSALPVPWDVAVPDSDLDLDLPMLPGPLQKIFKIRTKYIAQSAAAPKLAKPELLFSGALEELKKILDTLSNLTGLPFDFDVSVTAGGGASPSFIVRMKLIFRIGEGPNERVDVGLGKFYGQFLLQGTLEAAATGVERAVLFLEFQGDVQQGILPPVLYAGGLFRFGIELPLTGRPVIQLTLGAVASIGGDLIKGLLEVEVTVKYGYTLIPETLEPGVLLGLEARAKLLAGLVGFSFGVEAMARIKRASPSRVTVWAQIRVAASVQVAVFIEEDVDFQTQFEQDIPLAIAAVVPGVGLAGLAPALADA